jgi:hypothetical protein
MSEDDMELAPGGGNVFRDLGLPYPDPVKIPPVKIPLGKHPASR